MSDRRAELYRGVEIGDPVYNGAGHILGNVRGLDSAGFYVLAEDREAATPVTEIRDVTGTAYLMWRCWECGEMGELSDALPDQCPSCSAPKEELYYWAED